MNADPHENKDELENEHAQIIMVDDEGADTTIRPMSEEKKQRLLAWKRRNRMSGDESGGDAGNGQPPVA
jgi:hypothetical protein